LGLRVEGLGYRVQQGTGEEKGLQLTVNDEDQKKTCRQEATLVSTGQYLRGYRPGFHGQNPGSRV